MASEKTQGADARHEVRLAKRARISLSRCCSIAEVLEMSAQVRLMHPVVPSCKNNHKKLLRALVLLRQGQHRV